MHSSSGLTRAWTVLGQLLPQMLTVWRILIMMLLMLSAAMGVLHQQHNHQRQTHHQTTHDPLHRLQRQRMLNSMCTHPLHPYTIQCSRALSCLQTLRSTHRSTLLRSTIITQMRVLPTHILLHLMICLSLMMYPTTIHHTAKQQHHPHLHHAKEGKHMSQHPHWGGYWDLQGWVQVCCMDLSKGRWEPCFGMLWAIIWCRCFFVWVFFVWVYVCVGVYVPQVYMFYAHTLHSHTSTQYHMQHSNTSPQTPLPHHPPTQRHPLSPPHPQQPLPFLCGVE